MEDVPGSDLRDATLAGVRWITLSRVAAELGAAVSLVTLARLIPPVEFGHAAVALGVAAIATIGMAQTFGAPLVQRAELERRHWETATAMTLAAGLAATALVLALALTAARPLFGDRTADLLALMSPAFLLAAFGTSSMARLQRRLDFRRLGGIEAIASLTGVTAGITLAAAGVDGEAIVAAVLTNTSVSSLLLVAVAGMPQPAWHRETAGELTTFGFPAGFTALIYTLYRNVDYAILAARLGASQLGFYFRAFQLGIEYPGRVSAIMLRIAFPVYSRSGGIERMRAVRQRIVRVHATALVPPLGLFVGLAPALVPWLLGARWEPAVEPSQILAGAGILATVMTEVGPIMLAAGRPRPLLVFDAITLVVFGVGVYVAAPHGIVAVSWTVLGVQSAIFLAAHKVLLEPVLGIPLREVLGHAAPGLATGAVAIAVSVPLVAALRDAGVADGIVVVVAVAVTVSACVATVRFAFAGAWQDLLLLARSVGRGGRAGGAPVAAAVAPER
jgi:O-antigen/teichoic acid export membrane protein